MKRLYMLLLLSILATGCGLTEKTYPYIKPSPTSTQTTTSTQTNTPTITAMPTWTPTASPTITPTRTPTFTKTPYPIPEGVLTRSGLQQKVNDWIDGKIILEDVERMLDEKTGLPLRLGLLGKQVLEEVVFMFYNIGFTIVEDKNGTPFLLNLVGFENGKGERFAFPFHNGKLFTLKTSLILGEYNGKRIGRGQIIFQDRFTPLQYVQMGSQFLDFVNVGTTLIGSEGKDSEIDRYAQESEQITRALVQFLACNECSLQDIPKSLENFINKFPERFDPTIPYLMIIKVGY